MTPKREERWDTSVDSLVRLFRDALVALAPVLDAAHIPWRDGEAYDQWDAIAKVLYDNLVVEPLAWAFNSESQFQLATYDLLLSDYSEVSFIEARHSSLSTEEQAAFLRFATDREPLDCIEAVVLGSHLEPTERVERIRLDEVTFELRHKAEHGEHVPVTEVAVPS